MPEMRERPFLARPARGYGSRFIPPASEVEFSTARIDWFAVERAVNGDEPRPGLNPHELREAALWLRRHGMARALVSVHLSVYERLVKEWEAEAGMLGPDQLCTEPGCGKARVGRGLCVNHLLVDRKWRQAVAGLGMAA